MNTKEPFVITISREVGSGGHTVGRILAEKLNVRYCDKQLLESLEKQFGLSAGQIEKLKGEKKSWFADFFEKVSPMPSAAALGIKPEYSREFRVEVTSEDIFKAESEILKGFAQLGPCVVAGRSGFFVLKDHPNKLDVFISASLPNRIERVMRKQNLSRESAQSVIEEIDKARENYIQRFAGVSRYDSRNYDLCINAGGHSEEELADLILSYIKTNLK